MGKPYSAELSELPRTFAWAMASDITALRKAVRTSGLYPLLAIGSGGSLTAAHALAALHRHRTSRLAAFATPLEAVAEPLEEGVATWLISAGGRNADILAAFRALVAREARQLCVLCGREGSTLMELAGGHAHVDAIVCEPPSGKDGFLATNSLLAFVTLLSRAYKEEYGEYDADGKSLHAVVEPALSPASELVSGWRAETERLWCRETIPTAQKAALARSTSNQNSPKRPLEISRSLTIAISPMGVTTGSPSEALHQVSLRSLRLGIAIFRSARSA